MDGTQQTHAQPGRADAVAIWIFVAAGAVIAVWTMIAGIARIVQVVSGGPVPVTVDFTSTETTFPMSAAGEDVTVQLDRGSLIVPGLPQPVAGIAVLEQIVLMATIVTSVVCLILLSRSVLQGRVFGRVNTRLITTAGMVALVGFGTAGALGSAVGHETLNHLSDGEFEGAALAVLEPFPFVLAAFAFAIIGTAFAVGDRLRRETKGLV